MTARARPASPDQPVSRTWRVPFNRPYVAGRERAYVQEAIDAGHLSGGGPFTRRCREILSATLGGATVVMTTSGTHALEMAALLLEVGAGDEVLVPSFTFASTANAFALRGARPVFVDVRPDTLNMDEEQIEAHMTIRTKAMVPVHYAGVACEMEAIVRIASRAGVAVVEDNAHGLFGRYHGRPLGTFGAFAALSFHETKNVTSGEGGALVLNEARFIDQAEIIGEKGTDRGRFFRGEVDRYTWVDLGSSYAPSDVLAAILCAQLEARGEIQRRRKVIWERYAAALAGWAGEHGARLPLVPAGCEQPYHLFYLLLPDGRQRRALAAHLMERGILAVFHYQPLHLSRMGRRFGGRPGDCPVSEGMSERLLRLPLYAGMEYGEQDLVIAAILDFRG